MDYIILIFGILILVAGITMLMNPDAICGPIRSRSESFGFHIFAVVVRLILGIALIFYATESKYPLALQIIGWISLAASSLLLGIGRPRFQKLMIWALNLVSPVRRLGGLLGMLFGGFLVYAMI